MAQILYHSYGKTGIAAFVMPISVESGMKAGGREISRTVLHAETPRQIPRPARFLFGNEG